MALFFGGVLVFLCVGASSSASTHTHSDYGGVPLWVDRLLGEPSVLSLHGRIDQQRYRANNPATCPDRCYCPIQWPTALYCDQRALLYVPASLPEDTQYLFVQNNNISSLSGSVLAKTTGLRWLILDHNQLRSDRLDGAALQNLTELRYLFANHNQLTTVPRGLPAGLQQLRLAHNQISSISAETFRDLRNLMVLLLQGNRLTTIKKTEFSGLLNLELLDLSENLFSSVPKHLPPSVQQLYVSNNSISVLEESSFEGLDGLKYLRLSHCGLRSSSLRPQAFNISTLVELDLSYNRLSVTPTVPTTLLYLYLEANEIQEFKLTSFCRDVGPLSYSKMRILRMDGNKMTYSQLPPDWVFCLRVLRNIYV